MTTANAAATLERATDFAADYAAATLTFSDGVTNAVTHTLAGWVASNDTDDGLATANAIAEETIANTVNPIDRAVLTAAGKSYTLTVGTSAGPGVDVVINTLNYIAGQPSNVDSLVFRFPAA